MIIPNVQGIPNYKPMNEAEEKCSFGIFLLVHGQTEKPGGEGKTQGKTSRTTSSENNLRGGGAWGRVPVVFPALPWAS